LAPGRPAAARVIVTGLEISLVGDSTRLTLGVSEDVGFTAFTLADPYRVVIDLPEVEWSLVQGIPPKQSLIANLRYGQFTPSVARLVLDMRAPIVIRRASTERAAAGAGFQLVLDIVATTGAAFERLTLVVPPTRSDGGAQRQHAALRQLNEKESRDPPKSGPVASAPNTPKPPPPRPDHGMPLIVIDPGHGGVDPGAIGLSGAFEKNINLSIARMLADNLEATGRYRARLTRTSDTFIRLAERVEIARRAGAALFISLHADRHDDPQVQGASVYTLSENASDAEAEALAQRENKSDLIAGVDLGGDYDEEVTQILISLAQQSTMNCSARLAGALVPELGRYLELLPKTHRFAGFRVLKAPDVPSVLVEMGYLSNRTDERLLQSRAHQKNITKGIIEGIDQYFDRNRC
jgi:N-acetylmuramoyl-L-alanine amidase